MVKENKLSYYQICKLVAEKRYYAIPDGYKIVWAGQAPQKLFDMVVGGDCLKYITNDYPIPHKIKVEGEIIVSVPSPYDIAANEPMEYGIVPIITVFSLNELTFIYSLSQENVIQFWSNMTNTMLSGIIKKSDYVFDAVIELLHDKIDVKNVYLSSCCTDTNSGYLVKLNYDYVFLTPILK